MHLAESKVCEGQIQNLSAQQEIVLKQVWAHFLRYAGYDIEFTKEELANPECFIASASSRLVSLVSISKKIRNSIHSLSSVGEKKSLLPEAMKHESDKSRRHSILSITRTRTVNELGRLFHMLELPHEEYVPVNNVSEKTCHIYMHHYQALFERNYSTQAELDNEDASSDCASIQSFATATLSMEEANDADADTFPIKRRRRSSNTPAANAALDNTAPTFAVPTALASMNSIVVTPQPDTFSFMSKGNPRKIHNCLMSISRQNFLDNYIMCYVRASKNNYKKASKILFASMRWNTEHFPLAKWLLEGDAKSYIQGSCPGLIKNLMRDKSWVAGEDLQKGSLVVFVVRNHFLTDSTTEDVHRYLILLFEWFGLFSRPVTGSDYRYTVLFDCTDFTLKNGDYHAFKFLIDLFTAVYPDILRNVLIYNAPWIFSSFWNIAKSWVGPLVASKIHFVPTVKQVLQYVDIENLPVSMGGKNEIVATYPIPEASDMRPPKRRDANYTRLARERDELMMRFIETTRRWIHSTNLHVSAKYLEDKIQLGIDLSDNYIALDPYIRCRGVFDRNGSLNLRN